MPIATFNSPNFQILDVVYGGFHMNSYFFSIKIEPTQVIYKIIKNNVRSSGSARQGSLVIGMSIPKGYKLNGNVSPYDVLKNLLDTFLSSCMICKDAATSAYEYINGIIKPTIMDEVARQYQLVRYAGPHRSMRIDLQSVGYIMADEAKIRQLLSDVQYPAFANFSEVLVANTSSAVNYTHITNVEIPRVREYRIMDGVKNDAIVRDLNEPIVRRGQKDERYYTNSSVSFTLGALLRGESVANVRLDNESETILIDTKSLSLARERDIRVVVSPSNISSRDIIISTPLGNLELSPDYTFTLRGEQMKLLESNGGIRPLYRGSDNYAITDCMLQGNEYVITMKKQMISHASGKTGYGAAGVAGMEAKELVISLGENTFDKKKNKLNIRSGEKITYRLYEGTLDNQLPKLRGEDQLRQSKTSGRYECSLYIPKSWWPRVVRAGYGKITIGDNTFESKVESEDNGLVAKEFKPSSIRNPKADTILAKCLIILVVGILIGGLGGYMLKNWQVEKAKVPCAYCSHVASSQHDLDSHMRSTHPRCDKCNRIFPSSGELKKHIEQEHQFKCPICKIPYDNEGDRDECKKDCEKLKKLQQQQERAAHQGRTTTGGGNSGQHVGPRGTGGSGTQAGGSSTTQNGTQQPERKVGERRSQ